MDGNSNDLYLQGGKTYLSQKIYDVLDPFDPLIILFF